MNSDIKVQEIKWKIMIKLVKIRLLIKVLENDTSEYMVVSKIVLNQDYSAVDAGLIKKVLLGIIRKIVFGGRESRLSGIGAGSRMTEPARYLREDECLISTTKSYVTS